MKTLDLDKIKLLKGAHQPDSQYCVMELAAYIAGEEWSDKPECERPVAVGSGAVPDGGSHVHRGPAC